MAACLVRVPTEVVKQRQQTSAYGATSSTLNALRMTVQAGGITGLYRGYTTTVMREVRTSLPTPRAMLTRLQIPFSCVQFPLYERLKSFACRRRGVRDPLALPARDAALCGSASGAFAAAVTTPLDVAKTRIMLDRSAAVEGTLATLRKLYVEEGLGSLFRGVAPRTMWMGLGGSVFLGCYEAVIRRTNALR
jgi:solute carrier family 25 S-adenosylmethionine transporter 26